MKRILLVTIASVIPVAWAEGWLQNLARVQPSQRPEFDAVSITPSVPGNSGATAIGASANPSTIRLTGITIKDVIARAYSLKRYQISGPTWLDEDCYEIIAKSPPRTSESEQRLMLQSMLADRFQLVAHNETRVLTGYEMVAGNKGPKLSEAKTFPLWRRSYAPPMRGAIF